MSTTRSGTNVPLNLGVGAGALDLLTLPGALATTPDGGYYDVTDTASKAAPVADTAPHVSYLWYLLGIFIILLILKFASEHERSHMQLHLAGIGVYNFVVIGIMALLFGVVAKIIVNKYPVKGLTDIVNMA